MKKDSAFKYWEQDFQISTYGIVYTGFFGNFKVFRMLYSRFNNRREFDAVFTDELILYRTIMFTSVIYILLVALPILVACIFVLVYIRFGYQLQMFGIEMCLIEISMFIFMIIELFKIRKHINTKKIYKFNQKDRIGSKFMVMSGAPDDDLGSERMQVATNDD